MNQQGPIDSVKEMASQQARSARKGVPPSASTVPPKRGLDRFTGPRAPQGTPTKAPKPRLSGAGASFGGALNSGAPSAPVPTLAPRTGPEAGVNFFKPGSFPPGWQPNNTPAGVGWKPRAAGSVGSKVGGA